MISAVIPAFQKVNELRRTLHRICECNPAPAEIIVHVDGGCRAVQEMLDAEFPSIRTISSPCHIGPGGSRHQLILNARHAWVANFDDDSFPLDRSYFSRVADAIKSFPDTAVFSASTFHAEDDHGPVNEGSYSRTVPVFSGCGCVYKKSYYMRTLGYVPLPVAYGMEEVDISLQIHALGGKILEIPGLRVFHHDPYLIVPSDEILAFSIANIALFGYLRFPVVLWPLVPLQVLSRILWAIGHGWSGGIGHGLAMIPRHLAKYAAYRHPIFMSKILSWLQLRHTKSPT